MKLQEGKKYKNRRGWVRGPLRKITLRKMVFPYTCPEHPWESWDEDGFYLGAHNPTEWDLIEEVK